MRRPHRRRGGGGTMMRVALESPVISQGATFRPLEGGGARIVTPKIPWHDAVGFRVDLDGTDGTLVLIGGRKGQVEVNLVAADGTPVSRGSTVATGETRLVFAETENAKPARWLMIRNGASDGAAECDVHALFAGSVPTVELSDDIAALALRNPTAAKEACVERAWPQDVVSLIGTPRELPIRIEPPRAPWPVPIPQALWSGPMETTALTAAEDLIGLLDEFRPESLESRVAPLQKDAMRSYLRMNVVRVVRLVELLRRRGIERGTVLEVGAWFGSFSLALSRLGYDVVACDRYSSYGQAFDANVALMREADIDVVSTSREHELDQISGLGQFDVVLAAAVIDHVPHTPRLLLERLFATVRPGFVLAVDTPNVARYWTRRALERGETIFQPLEH